MTLDAIKSSRKGAINTQRVRHPDITASRYFFLGYDLKFYLEPQSPCIQWSTVPFMGAGRDTISNLDISIKYTLL